MAISQTMSNSSSDWIFQPYQNDFSHSEFSPTTDALAASTVASASRNSNLSPEQGRVSKPIRRRSRASRRTPTTLLNTDTTNFRAMVQHFTGGPAAPFSAARAQITNRGGAALNFMAGGGAPESGFHVQYPNQLQQQHMFMIDHNIHGGGGGGGGGGGAPPQAPAAGSQNRNYNSYMI